MTDTEKDWFVYGKIVGCKLLGVFQGNTPEEAIEKAQSSGDVGVFLCHQCYSECVDAEIEEFIAEPA